MSRTNHWAVLVLVLVHQGLGFLWYSPFLFLNQWLTGLGKTKAQMNPSDPVPFIAAILASIVSCYIIAFLVDKTHSSTFGEGVMLGITLFLGLVVPAIAPHYLFAGVAKPVLLIDLSGSFVTTLITAVVLSVWQRKPREE